MTLVAIEGFDHMSSTDLMYSKNWTWQHTQFCFDPSFSTGRVTGHSFRMNASIAHESGFGRLVKSLGATYDHFVCGFAVNTGQMPGLGASANVFQFYTETGGIVCTINVTQPGRIQVLNSGGSVVAQSATDVFTAQAWHFFELKAVVNGASSTVEMYMDNVQVIASTSCNLGSTAVGQIGPYSVTNVGWDWDAYAIANISVQYDDLYFLDTTSSPNNTFLGDCHVETLFPNADGTHSDWTPDTGLVHYSRVNERTGTYPDGDTSYVVTNAVNNQDTWQYDDLSITSGTVFGLQTNLYARKEDANLRQLVPLIVRSATTYPGTTVQTLASSYVDSTEIFEVDPSTSLAWTVTAVNAAEFGAKVQT